jgi:hypothetical protein
MDIFPKSDSSPAADQPKKRGRPAGSTKGNSSIPKGSSEVEAALATLETAYQFLCLGLTMVGAPQAASDLAEKIEFVQEQNRGYLTADRKLAQQISKVGSASGRAGFMITNFMALAPVVLVAAKEISAKRETLTPTSDTPEETVDGKPVTKAPVSTYNGAPVPDVEEY